MPSTSSEVETLGASERGADAHLEKSTAPPQPVATDAAAPPDVPDGGLRAWTVVAGATLTLFSSFGVVNSYGVFQSYYNTSRLTQEGESVLALLGAIQLACLYGLGPLIGKIFDSYGCSILMPLGSLLIVFSLMMLSICQPDQLYQYFLSQAVLFGIGCAMVFTPALAILGHWFRHRRGLALGIVAGGSSLGGVIYPITLQRLLPRIGFGWAVRTMAFIDLACLAFACATMRTRLPLRRQPAKSFLKFIDVGGFRDARFCLATALAFFMFYALFIPYFFIKQYAELQGMRPGLSQYLLPIINATGIPSRILPGLLADRIGVLNLLIPMVLGSGVLVLALWLPARGDAAIICFAAFYGLLSGGFVSLLPAYIARISPQSIYGARLGSVYAFVAIANLVGTPTAGAFVKAKTQEGFARLIGFTGALVIGGGCFGAVAWWLEYRKAKREAREKGVEWRWYTIPKI